MNVGLVGHFPFAAGPEPVDELVTEVEANARLLVTPQAYGIHVADVHLEPVVPPVYEPPEIVQLGISVGRHAHHLVLTVEHLEPEIFGHRAVDSAQGVRVVEFLDPVDTAVLAVAEERGSVLALAIHAHDGRLLGKAAEVVCAGGMGEVMLHGLETGPVPVDAHLVTEL